MYGGNSSGNQTVTQQNIPSWAMDYAQNTLDMGRYYTNNQDYRPSTLDRDYSGIRGYNSQGRPNSQVGQYGLNPNSASPQSVTRGPASSGWSGGFGGGLLGGFGGGAFGGPVVPSGFDGAGRPVQNQPMPVSVPDDLHSPRPGTGLIENPNSPGFVDDRKNRTSRGMGRSTGYNYSDGYGSGDYSYSDQGTDNYYGSDTYDGSFTDPSSYSDGYDESDSGYDITSPPAVDGGLEFSNEDSWVWGSGNSGNNDNTSSSSDSSSNNQTTLPAGMSQEEVQALIDEQLQQFDANTITPDEMPTPFQAYDRQRFAAPNANTLTGESLMAGRYANRFGPSGTDPFASAISSAQQVANYGSKFTPAAIDISGPRANTYSNVNAGLTSSNYGNANQNLQGPVNYQGQRSFQQNLSQFENPYTSQVVDQTIKDLDRARRITDMDISSNAAKQGAFGGSREALMRSENARNFADRTAAAVGQLRSQGFQKAADLAQQEQLQRLGLTAQDLQNVRGYASQGNLQGQNLTAQDLQNVRGLISQGGLAAQTLGAQSDRDAMNYANQLKMQGNQLNVEQARLAEQFRQGAGALNLQGANALGNLQQMSIADERQRIADMLAAGAGQSERDQQDLDFIYSEFNRELDYPGRQIDLRNAAISPATGSIVQTTQPRYQSNPLLGAAGAGLSAYGMTGNPYAAGGAALLSLLYG